MKLPTRPKYQVFVSSTFLDLHEERKMVTWAILKRRHIPVGMENFSSSNDRGWKIIKKLIDTTDYYVLIVGGRYGHYDEDWGSSWTEKEYNYAVELGIPILAFLREPAYITQDKIEINEAQRQRLESFRSKIRDRHHCERWTTPSDLVAKVTAALSSHVEDDEDDGNPRPGWYRGDQLPQSPVIAEELARLSAENSELRVELKKLRSSKVTRLSLEIENLSENIAEFGGKKVTIKRFDDPLFPSIGEPTYSQALSYADQMNRISRVHAAVRNDGDMPATNVIIDFEFGPATDLHEEWPTPDWRVVGLAQIQAKNSGMRDTMATMDRPRLLEQGEETVIKVRHRIGVVPPHSEEQLVPMAVEGLAQEDRIDILVHYRMVSDSGLASSGHFVARRTLTECVEVTLDELRTW